MPRGTAHTGSALRRRGESREQIERDTDAQTAPVLAALGDDLEELVQLLLPWGRAIREAKGYPASGPHDLARVAAAG